MSTRTLRPVTMLQASGVIRDFRVARDFGEGQGFTVTGWIMRLFLTSHSQIRRLRADSYGSDRGRHRREQPQMQRPPPDGNGAGKQPALLERQRHDTALAVRGVHGDLKQTPALQWSESGCQCRAIHSEQRFYCPHVWCFWPVQGHH